MANNQSSSWYGGLTDIFMMDKEEAVQNNYKLEDFEKYSNVDEVSKLSVIDKYFKEQNKEATSFNYESSSFTEYIYGSVSTNKPARLSNYRRMSGFPEVSDAIDEISDAAITLDENNKVVKLKINSGNIEGLALQEIQDSFDEYVELFNFEKNMFEYTTRYVIDGEICWENLISQENQDLGIVGINSIAPESFEYAIDLRNNEKVGIIVWVEKSNDQIQPKGTCNQTPGTGMGLGMSGISTGGISTQNLNMADEVSDGSAIFLPWDQITYISTGKFNSAGTMVYPVLERARKAYNQLSLIEDAIIIYRLVRAPERLVFNVDTGTLPRQRAEEEVQKIMKRYQSKKVYNPTTGTVANGYDAHHMLENYFFVKPAGSEGTEVDTLGGAMNLGELDDLYYFVKKLYISLKIPFSRYLEPTVNIENVDSISYEEFRFAKFIMRIQNSFASGVEDGFITHLKLKGLWAQHKLKRRDLVVVFTPPIIYEIYNQQRLLEMKLNNYSAFNDAMESMNSYAMEKYLELSPDEINKIWRIKEEDAYKNARIEYGVSNIEESGEPTPALEENEEDW